MEFPDEGHPYNNQPYCNRCHCLRPWSWWVILLEYLLEQVELEPSQEIAQEILLDQQRMLQ
jgi:hypothetical protein